jgi:hypothetical protein
MILFWLFAICRTIGQMYRNDLASLPWSVFGQTRQNVDWPPSRFAPISERPRYGRGAFAPSAEDAAWEYCIGLHVFARSHELDDLSVPAPPGIEARCCAMALV